MKKKISASVEIWIRSMSFKTSAQDGENRITARSTYIASDFYCSGSRGERVGNFTLTKGLIMNNQGTSDAKVTYAVAALQPRANNESIYKSNQEWKGSRDGTVSGFHRDKGIAGIVFSAREWLRQLNEILTSGEGTFEEGFPCNRNGEFDMSESNESGMKYACTKNVHWWEKQEVPFRTGIDGNGHAVWFRLFWNGQMIQRGTYQKDGRTIAMTSGPTSDFKYTIFANEGKGGGFWGGKERERPNANNGTVKAQWYCDDEAGVNDGVCQNVKFMKSSLTRTPFPVWSKRMIKDYWNIDKPIPTIYYTIVPNKAVNDSVPVADQDKPHTVLLFLEITRVNGCTNSEGAATVNVQSYIDPDWSAFNGTQITIKHPQHCMSGKVNLDQRIEHDFCPIMARGGCLQNKHVENIEYCSGFASSSQCNLSIFPVSLQDQIVQGICNIWPLRPECICHARVNWGGFEKALKEGKIITNNNHHVCWWQPCKDDLQSVLKTSEDKSKRVSCGDFCINYADYENIGGSEFGDINMIVVCNRNTGPPPTQPPPPPTPSPTNEPTPGPTKTPTARPDVTPPSLENKNENALNNILENKWVWVLLLATVVGALAFIVYYAFFKPKTPTQAQPQTQAPAQTPAQPQAQPATAAQTTTQTTQ